MYRCFLTSLLCFSALAISNAQAEISAADASALPVFKSASNERAPVRRFMPIAKYRNYPVKKVQTPPSSTKKGGEVILTRENSTLSTDTSFSSHEQAQLLLAIFSETPIDR